MKNNKLSFLDIIVLLIGCSFMSISLNMFFEPHQIAPGGITGFAIVINYLFDIPLWALNLLLNIPLFLFAYKILSKKDLIKTLLGVIFLSLTLNLTIYLSNIQTTSDSLLATIYGSILMGIGLGLIFRINGSTGGTDLIGVLINKYMPHISIATLMGMTDFLVVILAILVTGQIEVGLYSAISLYITVRVSDIIVEGFDYHKSFMIISDKYEEISDVILNNLNRGATILKGEGVYTKDNKNVLLVVVSRKEVVELKRLIKEVDMDAFIIITDVHETIGNGFKKIN